MTGLLQRIPYRESKVFVIVCAVVFAALLGARAFVEKRYNNKGHLERRYKAEVTGLRARGLDKEADELRRERTITEQEKRIEDYKAQGRVISPEAYVPVWLYKGLHANLALAGALLLASPWLGRRRKEGMNFAPEPQRPPFPKWQYLACAAVMGFAAWQNAPRLFHSMWGDEEFNASRFILDGVAHDREGNPVPKATGGYEIEPRSWTTTLWNMRKPTNHLGYSFFARLTHGTFFEGGAGPTDPWFSEALLRAPVFVAGLLLLPALLWALRVWGMSGWWAVLFMAVHPWFVRFGVDGRGYGFVMLGITLLVGVLGRALQTGRWRWWLALGAGEFFIFWSNLHSAYLIVALNLMALTGLFTSGQHGEVRRLQLVRWFTGNIFALMLLVGFLAPCLPQFLEFLKEGAIRDTLDLRWWQDSFCALEFGVPWFPWQDPENPLMLAMSLSVARAPILHVTGMALFTLVVLWGAVAIMREARLRPMLVLILGAPAMMIAHMAIAHVRPYDWYLVPYLPGIMMLVAAAFRPFAGRCGKGWAVAAMTVALAGFVYVTQEARQLLREHPIEPSRESVAHYRSVTNPRHPEIDDVIGAGLSMYTEGYDPALYRVKDVAAMRELMAEADRSGRPLWFNCGFMRFLRIQEGTAPMCKLLEDETLFEHAQTFPGLLPFTTRDVYRYKGAAK